MAKNSQDIEWLEQGLEELSNDEDLKGNNYVRLLCREHNEPAIQFFYKYLKYQNLWLDVQYKRFQWQDGLAGLKDWLDERLDIAERYAKEMDEKIRELNKKDLPDDEKAEQFYLLEDKMVEKYKRVNLVVEINSTDLLFYDPLLPKFIQTVALGRDFYHIQEVYIISKYLPVEHNTLHSAVFDERPNHFIAYPVFRDAVKLPFMIINQSLPKLLIRKKDYEEEDFEIEDDNELRKMKSFNIIPTMLVDSKDEEAMYLIDTLLEELDQGKLKPKINGKYKQQPSLGGFELSVYNLCSPSLIKAETLEEYGVQKHVWGGIEEFLEKTGTVDYGIYLDLHTDREKPQPHLSNDGDFLIDKPKFYIH